MKIWRLSRICKITCSILTLTGVLTACNTLPVKQGKTLVYKADGSLTCNEDTGGTLNEMKAELVKKNIPVLSSHCGNDGFVRAAVCGIETGRINIYQIESRHLSAAQSIGFKNITILKDYKKTGC
jgi:hypothetical protein